MTISGPETNDGAALLSSTGDYGNSAHQMLTNFQMDSEGGQGFLRIYTFKADRETVEVKTYSPVLEQYHTDAREEFNLQLSPSL